MNKNLNFYLEQGIWNGNKRTDCPVCGKNTFYLKSQDTIAKCFHPSCGFFAIAGFNQRTGLYRNFYDFTDKFFEIAHNELIFQQNYNLENAYKYLIHRQIHPDVIELSDMGVFEYSKHYEFLRNEFDLIIQTAYEKYDKLKENIESESALKKITKKRKKELIKEYESLEDEIEFLKQSKEKFFSVFNSSNSGNLIFFYRGKDGNIKSIKTRKPFGNSKTCRYFKPFKTVSGFFNHTLFSPDKTNHDNKIILFEGDFNTLQIQSLAKKNGLSFIHSASWGGANNLNTNELEETGWEVIICYDNDTAGRSVINKVQKKMTIEAFTTPNEGSDMDSFITSFEEQSEAWKAVKKLIKERKEYFFEPESIDFARVFDKNGNSKINYPTVADHFIKKYKTFSVSDMTYYYKNGYYHKDKGFLASQICRLLDKDFTLHGDKEVMGKIQRSNHHKKDNTPFEIYELDPNARELINLENGMLDWQTGNLYSHKPEHLSTIRIPIIFDASAICPQIDRFLDTTFEPEVIPLIEEIAGYCLIPEIRTQCFVILAGSGSNGKSLCLTLFSSLVGDNNITNTSLKELEENRFASANLYMKLIATGSEIEGYFKNSDLLKRLTGEDLIRAENKFKDPFTFKNHSKIMFTSNDIPTFSSKDFGLYRRCLIIPFTKMFHGKDRDPNLKKKITTANELSGFLNRALAGLRRLNDNNYEFTRPRQVEQALENFQKKNDNLRYFISEFIEITGNQEDFISSSEFYREYSEFCKTGGLGNPCPINRLTERLSGIDEKIGYGRKRTGIGNIRTFTGIRFMQ